MFRSAQHDSAINVMTSNSEQNNQAVRSRFVIGISSLFRHSSFELRHLNPGLQPTRDICFLRADVSPCRN
jgi:hypothetical protein